MSTPIITRATPINEILEFIEDPSCATRRDQGWGRTGVAQPDGNYQNIGGRITRVSSAARRRRRRARTATSSLTKRWMDAMGIDLICLFPTPMLALGMTPRADVEVALARAYNRWLCDKVLAQEPRIRSMLYLPFNDPEALHQDGRGFRRQERRHRLHGDGAAPPRRVTTIAICGSTAMLEERGLPLAFHGGFTWQEQTFATSPTASSSSTRWASPSSTCCI